MNDFVIYVCDVEATGLDFIKNDIIELSLYRLTDNIQKTWCIKPINPSNIESVALRINGHKLEDITHQTKYGKETYLESSKAIIDIENFVLSDGVPTEKRVLCGQNVGFDKNMMEQLWIKCESKDSFPFGRRLMDTMIWEFMLDYATNSSSEGYSLSNLTKKYGVKNEKSHSAAADTLATKEVFLRQVNDLRKKLCIK